MLRLGDERDVTDPTEEDVASACSWVFAEPGRTVWLHGEDGIVQVTSTAPDRALVEMVAEDDVTVLAQQAGIEAVRTTLVDRLPTGSVSGAVIDPDLAFATSPGDRSHNRAGEVTDLQKEMVSRLRPPRFGFFGFLVVAWVSPLVIMAVVLRGEELVGTARMVLGWFGAGWVVLGALIALWNSRHALTWRVLRVEGPVRLMPAPGLERGSWITVDGVDLPLEGAQRSAFEVGEEYRIHYVKRGGGPVPISAERLGGDPSSAPTEAEAARSRRRRIGWTAGGLAIPGLWFTPLLVPGAVLLYWGAPWAIWVRGRQRVVAWWARRCGVAVEYSLVSHRWHVLAGPGARRTITFHLGQAAYDLAAILASVAVFGGVLAAALLIVNSDTPLRVF